MAANSEVVLRLLLKGQREMAAGLADTTKQTSALGKAADKASLGAKKLSGGLDSVQKSGVGATTSSKALIRATKQVADAQQAAAAASKQAADVRLKAATALADATAKQAAGDMEGAKAAKAHADALQRQATAANRSAIAMRASASAARDQVTALKASAAAADTAARSGGGGSRLRMLAGPGGAVTKVGLAGEAFLGYEGVRRMGSFSDTLTRLSTQANVPTSQLPGLQRWMISNSPGLREDPNTLATQMYRIASSAPGKPYSPRQLKALTAAAARFSILGGVGTDPEQAARVFGIVRANGGLGTRNYNQIGAVANATIGSGDMTAGDYIAALGTGGLAVNAARHRVSLTQIGGALAQMGDLGVTGSRAGLSLQHAISLLASPSPKAQGIYASMGISPTMIDQVIRTKGLTAGMALLQRQMQATMPANMRGKTASTADLMAVGYTHKQARAMQKQGAASMEDLMLTQAFGGARQSIPIIALLNGLNRTRGKTAEIQGQSGVGGYLKKVSAAQNTPAQTWKRFDLDLQQLENNIGLKLIPKLEAMGNWLSRNEGAAKDFGIALGVVAIPAVAAYAAKLAMDGVSSVQRFTGALRGSNAEISKTGATAAAQSRGLGVLGSSVMAVTAAVGVWELGKATSKHGAGGALTAGLGGAMTGMMVGLSVGGPWGAVIGGAAGALIGLAGHFMGAANATDASTLALKRQQAQLQATTSWMNTAYGGDKNRIGAGFTQGILGDIRNNPAAANALAGAGVRIGQIKSGLRTGGDLGGAAGQQLQLALRTGQITQAQYAAGATELADLQTAFGEIVGSVSDAAMIAGHVSQYTRDSANTLQALMDSITGSMTGTTAPGGGAGQANVPGGQGLSGLLGNGLSGTTHVHVHVDGKKVAEAVHHHDRNRLARR